jgi:2-polyprenyl-3-methyl-5-hydroxy-6-metoxy-1,4-benzoquinol methylase
VAADQNSDALKTEELAELVREIRERVRARHPASSDGSAPFAGADLMPLVHARDAAESKVAAIGSVNPRRGGPLNALIQAAKRIIARGLDWFVRDQVVFNREVMGCVEATLEALNEMNRRLAITVELQREVRELKDIRAHWAAWRPEWEVKVAHNEMQFLRSVADLQGTFQHRVTLMENNFRDIVKAQHSDYLGALDRTTLDVQKRLWADLQIVRAEFERLIHAELSVLRQRLAYVFQAGTVQAPEAAAAPAPAVDFGCFPERFRGPEELVKSRQKFYLSHFANCKDVLDIGCGRGEFLELMREAGIPGRGIDLNAESVDLCRSKGLRAEVADLFVHLDSLEDASLDGIFSAQVVEHLPPDRVPEMIRLAARKLVRGGVIAIETPNPACLAIFATHFYLDPTHTRPVPYALLAFYMQECGIGNLERRDLSAALESFPSLAGLPEEFRNAFFGGLDYAIIGRKL